MNKILITILFSIILATLFYIIPNNSNISKYYIIPIIVSLIVKYIFGDWDNGSVYSISDIVYFIVIIYTSVTTIFLLDKYKKK